MNRNLEPLEERRLLAAVLGATGTLTITMTEGADVVSASLGGGMLTFNMSDGPAFSRPVGDILAVVAQLGGGSDSITMVNVGVPVFIFGGNGNDTLTGGSSTDTIQGGNGNDQINGGSGADRLDGGLNSDTIIGGIGNDTADYSGRSGNVTADLAGDKDDGEAGELDQIDSSVESIMGGSGNDRLTGDGDGNYLSGGAGADTLVGDLGNDILVGGAGQDAMYGNDGADAIFALDGEADIVDGGPGSDSAQTDPGEGAPVPGEDVIIPTPGDPLTTFVGPVYAPVFSSRQITRRPTPARRSGVQVAVSSDQVLAPASPVPGGPGGFSGDEPVGIEQPVTQALIDQLGTQLAPYAFGQVIVTRRFQGQVTIGGTSGNDAISLQTYGTQAGATIDIMVNGGLTRYLLPTPTLTMATRTGEDAISLIGDRSESLATLAPSTEIANSGLITLDGHQINYGQPGVLAPEFSFSALREFTLVTPQAADLIQLGDPNNPNSQATAISAYSGQFALPAVQLTGVSQLRLDLATNERGGGVDDQIVVNNLPQGAPDLFLTTLKYPSGGGGGNDRLVVNGFVDLANNPVEYEGVTPANVNVEVQSAGSIRFLAQKTELASLKLAANAFAALNSGDQTLYVHSLAMVAGVGGSGLNIADGNLIVDHDGSAAAAAFIRQLIINAYNPNAPTHWNAPGITSSFVPANPTTALGYGESAAILGPSGGYFRGVNRVDGTASLVSFTLLGDANLDRTVNFVDLVALAQNYEENSGSQIWIRGDFNYDGNTNFTDLVLLAQNYNQRLFT